MLTAGVRAPSFSLPDIDTGASVKDPWTAGRTVLAFFKTTCPVCVLVVPMVKALADGGARVVAIGEDPPTTLKRYADKHGQHVVTLSEPAPYEVSAAYGLSAVPTLVVVGADGIVEDTVGGWDRDRWNTVAESFGAPPVSSEGDGLPVFRPG